MCVVVYRGSGLNTEVVLAVLSAVNGVAVLCIVCGISYGFLRHCLCHASTRESGAVASPSGLPMDVISALKAVSPTGPSEAVQPLSGGDAADMLSPRRSVRFAQGGAMAVTTSLAPMNDAGVLVTAPASSPHLLDLDKIVSGERL
jgi:hypothetical protein